MSAKELSLDDIDSLITLLDNSVNGKNNREHPRKEMIVPVSFVIKSATGEMKEDIHRAAGDSKIIDLSKGGAALVTKHMFSMDEDIWVRGEGKKHRFHACLKVMNHRKMGLNTKYGCKILTLKMIR
jgi:hypothetical protein